MKILSARFVKSVDSLGQIPKPFLSEIAFAGRSNVGKSRLINTLVNRKNLAQISKNPGKTRLLNYFIVNEKFYFVDLPGYGYANVSKAEQEKWGRLLQDYFTQSKQLKGVVVITDARVGITEKDLQMIEYLTFYKLPFVIVATKTDKLSENQLNSGLAETRRQLSEIQTGEICPFSSVSGRGKDQLWHTINKLIDT